MAKALYFGIPVALLLSGLGLRVLARAGGLPDRMVGVFFLCLGVGSTPVLMAGNQSVVPPAAAPWAMAVGHFIASTGFTALYVFAWRCFGPDSSWRRILALTGGCALAVLWVVQGVVEEFAAPGGPVLRAAALVRALALAWAFGESLRYRARMRRRVRLGLADPVVANRFLLWSLWTGCILGSLAVVISVRFLLPGFGDATPVMQRVPIVTAVLSLATVGGLSLWLAFFPPRWYLVRLRDAAPAS